MSDVLLEPLAYGFVVRALVASVIVGVVCAAIGSFVVLRGMAFFGDAMAHAVLPGVALGYLLGDGAPGAVFAGAIVAAMVAALAIARLARRGGLKQDTAIGIVFAGMFALGIVLISTRRGYAVDLTHLLFGNVLGVAWRDVALVALLGLVVLGTLAALYKELLLVAFDPVQATTLRLPVSRLEALLLALVALTVVVALDTVGVALLVAMLVTPASTGYVVARRLPGMMAIGAAAGAASGVVGIYASYHLSRGLGVSVASGAAIVLVSTLLFGLATVVARTPWGRARRG